MKQWKLLLFLIAACLLAACGGSAETVEVTRVVADTKTERVVEEMASAAATPVLSEVESVTGLADGETQTSFPAAESVNFVPSQARLIIKNGEITLTVPDTTTAVNQITDLAAATGGYLINQRIWELDGHTYASLQFAVPVSEFERSLITIRGLGQVTRDIATGQDVTEEYVDLDSRLGNLEITQERLRTFLSEANKMDDIIKLNNELTRVEEELSLIKGRMNYLSERAAFSTITTMLDPLIPTPTPAPLPTVSSWQPGTTVQRAGNRLQTQMQSTADFALYNGIVCGPWLLFLALIGYIALRIYGRQPLRPLNRPFRPQNDEQETSEE